MKVKPITTGHHPEDPRPWAQFTVTDGSLVVTIHDLNGADVNTSEHYPEFVRAHAAKNKLKGTHEDHKKAVREHVKARMAAAHRTHTNLRHSKEKPTEEHMLVITLEGDVDFLPITAPVDFFFAHLAWHDPKTGEWSRLDFQTDGQLMQAPPTPLDNGWTTV